MKKKKLRILISVYDKSGLCEFIKKLQNVFCLEIISTGGTAKHLKKAGFLVTTVESVTGFPEILDGRVKTLHPAISGAILADQNNSKHMAELKKHKINPIDLVVCNLYPFEQTIAKKGTTVAQAIEQIDIGGVTLLRAAAKNFQSVIILSDPRDYSSFIRVIKKEGNVSMQTRRRYAKKAFSQTCHYDKTISRYFSSL